MIIAVDFDGTIVDHEFPKIGKEKPGAIRVLNRLKEKGHKIVIWTCRESYSINEMLKWLNENGFQPDAINENIDKNMQFAKKKVYADLYIDDRSFPAFTSWEDLEKELL
jgi:hydroxymethylpyrimidine pyrophosphatase-like HAD family hydrolase